jgi:hypothetical protein
MKKKGQNETHKTHLLHLRQARPNRACDFPAVWVALSGAVSRFLYRLLVVVAHN